MKRVEIIATGDVQNVGFRDVVQKIGLLFQAAARAPYPPEGGGGEGARSGGSAVGTGAIPAGRGYPWARTWARRGAQGAISRASIRMPSDPGLQSLRTAQSPGESSVEHQRAPTTTSRPQARPSFGKPPPPRSARRPQLSPPPSPAPSRSPGSDQSKKPTPQDDPDQKKKALGISVGSAPAPLPAGSVHGRIRPRRRRGPPTLRVGSKVRPLSGQRLPFSPRADNTLAQVRLHPVEADVEALFQVGPQPPDLSRRLVLPVEHLVLNPVIFIHHW